MSAAVALRTSQDLDQDDFERVRALIHRHAGISLNPSKRVMVFSRLSRRLRATGAPGFGAYLDRLESQPASAPEWQEFVNALTTNLTSFFREQHHFPVLAELLRQRAGRGPLRIWCCAASTGEEPYSIAMTAMQTFGTRTPPVSVLATDIDTAVLDTARRAVYPMAAVERVDPALLKACFQRNRDGDRVRVHPDVAAMVEFQPLNLLSPQWPAGPAFDAIFCRNVMIYFDKPTQRRLLERLAQRLTPGGLFFAGHSENFTHARDLFELRGKTVYRVLPGRVQRAVA